tara:strand:+ start:337 stop:507 length:171 start_codon:yes stop_codon:yes gene_type:complete
MKINPLTKNKNRINTSEMVRVGIISLPNSAKNMLTKIEKIVKLSIFLNGRTNNFLR